MSYSNERGVIAEQYSELQATAVLDQARRTNPLAPASPESNLRAVFQAVEIGLINLEDLVSRAANDVENRRFGAASVKLSWARGFHQVLVHLSRLPHRLGSVGASDVDGVLRLSESTALQAYLREVKRFDAAASKAAEEAEFYLDEVLAEESIDSDKLRLLHLSRLCSHETTIWERNLAEVHVSAEVPSYEEFVVARGMRDAVYDRVLEGDTFFTQFRGLHQIPEILCVEINDRIEGAIVEIDAGQLQQAQAHLRIANVLSAGILAALPPLTDNLATADYHRIRENLGLTSGSHSVNLHYHLFKDLYQQLWEALANWIAGHLPPAARRRAIERAISRAGRRPDRGDDFLLNLIVDECLELRSFINTWRDEHLQLPRNNLGSNRTRSLTGSVDAIKTVRGMRDAARARDPMQPLANARRLFDQFAERSPKPLTEYLQSATSLDTKIGEATGSITQRRFKHVQERLGVFAKECPFVPPPRRTVPSNDECNDRMSASIRSK